MTLPGILLALETSGKYDVELAKRLRRRETDAMTTLYDRFGRLAYSVILSIVRDGATAEDLVQETFLRVWNRIQGFEPGRDALGPWLLAMARNRAIEHVRSSSSRINTSPAPVRHGSWEPDVREQPGLFADAECAVLGTDHARTIRAAVEKLSDRQRQLIEFAYYEGLSQPEMAERLGESPDTVRTELRAALKLLRGELGQEVAA